MTKLIKSRINDLEIENAELRRIAEPTLRDQFAIAALTSMQMFSLVLSEKKRMAQHAYEMADAMMETRDANNV